MDQESYKVVLLGESGVGKTSIITQFIDETFTEDQQSRRKNEYGNIVDAAQIGRQRALTEKGQNNQRKTR